MKAEITSTNKKPVCRKREVGVLVGVDRPTVGNATLKVIGRSFSVEVGLSRSDIERLISELETVGPITVESLIRQAWKPARTKFKLGVGFPH